MQKDKIELKNQINRIELTYNLQTIESLDF